MKTILFFMLFPALLLLFSRPIAAQMDRAQLDSLIRAQDSLEEARVRETIRSGPHSKNPGAAGRSLILKGKSEVGPTTKRLMGPRHKNRGAKSSRHDTP